MATESAARPQPRWPAGSRSAHCLSSISLFHVTSAVWWNLFIPQPFHAGKEDTWMALSHDSSALNHFKGRRKGTKFPAALSCRLSQKFRNYWRFQFKQVLEPLMEIQGAPSCGYCCTLQHFLDLTPSWMGSFPSISYHLLIRFSKDYM